jgi:hypothetical protein
MLEKTTKVYKTKNINQFGSSELLLIKYLASRIKFKKTMYSIHLR